MKHFFAFRNHIFILKNTLTVHSMCPKCALTVTVIDGYPPHGTRWQCTAKPFYYGVFDAYRLKRSWSEKCHFQSFFGSFPVKFPPKEFFFGKFDSTKRFVFEFQGESLEQFLSYRAQRILAVYSQLATWLLKWTKYEMRLYWNAFLTIISKIVLSQAILFRGENGMKHSRIPWKHDNKKYAKVIFWFFFVKFYGFSL